MSSSVMDEKIVKLTLQYSSLKQGAQAASGLLSNLKDKITSLGNTKAGSIAAEGISSIRGAASTAISGVSELGNTAASTGGKFDALKTIATGALLTIGSTAAQKGAQYIKSLTLDPVIDGFKEYEMKIKSTQTIMTNTGRSIEDVNKVLDELNTYSDKTVYKFSDMTTAIGSMASAGIGLEDASTVVKGFYNAAAATGVEANRMGSLLQTALIPSLSRGYMGLQDFRQLSDAGFGQGFKDTVLEVAESMGIQVDKATAFNDALKDGWLTTDVLIEATKRFEANKAYEDAATKVKTFSDLLDTVGESVGSGWAQSWEIIIGSMDEAAEIFTPLQQEIDNIVQGLNNMRNNFLLAFKAAGGFTAILNIGKNIYQFFKNIVVAIMDAWKSVEVLGKGFGKLPGLLAIPFKIIEAITKKIADFKLIPTIIGGAFKILFTVLSPIMSLLIKTGEVVMSIWNKLVGVVKMVTNLFKDMGNAIKAMNIKGMLIDTFKNFITILKGVTVEPIKKLVDIFKQLGTAVVDSLKNWSIEPIKKWAGDAVKAIVDIFKAIKNLDFSSLFKPLQDAFGKLFQTIGESGTVKAFTAQMQAMKDAINDMKMKYLNFDWLKDIKQLQPLRDFANLIKNLKIEEYFAKPIEYLKEQLSKLSGPLKTVQETFGKLGDAIKNAFKGWSLQPIINWFNSLKESVVSLINNIKNLDFKSILSGFTTGFSQLVDTIANTDLVQGLVKQFEKLKDVLSSLGISIDFSWLNDLIIVQEAKKWFQGLKETVEGLDLGGKFDAAKQAISNFKDMIMNFDLAETIKSWNDNLQAFLDKIDFGPLVDVLNNATIAIGNMARAFAKWFGEVVATPAFKLIQNGFKTIVDWISKINGTTIAEGTNKAIEKIGDVTETAGQKVKTAGQFIKDGLKQIGEWVIQGLKWTAEGLVGLWDGVTNALSSLKGILDKASEMLSTFVSNVKEKLGGALSTENLMKGGFILFIGMFLNSIRKLAKGGGKLMESISSMFDVFGNISEVLEAVQEAFKNFTKNITPGNILKVAGAIAILALSLKVLESVDAKKVPQTLGLLAGALTAMTGSMLLINKFSKNPASMLAAAGSIQSIATALLIVSAALKVISTIDEADLDRSVTALGGIFIMMGVAVAVMGGFEKKVNVAVKGLMGMAASLIILSFAVKAFADIPTDDLIKGGIATGVALAAMVIAIRALDDVKVSMGTSLALGALVGSLMTLAEVVKQFGSMSWGTLAKGLLAVGAGLAAIVGSFLVLKNVGNIKSSALSIMMVSMALGMLVIPIKSLGSMKLATLAKGLGTVVLALAAITGALYLLSNPGAMAGAGAILATVAAINLLIPPIVILGTLKMSTLAQGLIAIAAGLAIVVAAGYLAIGAAPGLVAIAGAFMSISLAAVAITVVLYGVIAVMSFLAETSKDTFQSLIDNVLFAVTYVAEKAPEFAEALLTMIEVGLGALVEAVPMFANAGIEIILGLMTAVRDHIYEFVTLAGEIITEFCNGLADQAEPLATAGLNLITSLINAMATAVDENGNQLLAAILNLTQQILELVIDALVAVVDAMFGWIPGFGDTAKNLGETAKNALGGAFNRAQTSLLGSDAAQGTVDGINSKAGDAEAAGDNVASRGVAGLGSKTSDKEGNKLGTDFTSALGNKASESLRKGTDVANQGKSGLGSKSSTNEGNKLGNEFTSALGSKTGDAKTNATNVANSGLAGFDSVDASSSGANFGEGFAGGISSKEGVVSKAASGLANLAKGAVEKILAIFSPSRVMRKDGGFFGEGFRLGIDDKKSAVEKSAKTMAITARDGVVNTLEGIDSDVYDLLDFEPVITPVVDTSNVKMDNITGVAKVYSNQTIEGTVSFEAKLLDKFNELRTNLNDAVKDITDRAIVVENYMDKTQIGKMVAQPVTEAQQDRDKLLDAVFGRG